MEKRLEILAATGNPGKIMELSRLLADFPIKLRTLSDFENISEVEETGTTFSENAILKAKGYALQTNCWAIADDSGLEVEALGNKPGVFSARYGSKDMPQSEKNDLLLNELKMTGQENRQARFVCAIAISDELGNIVNLSEGICVGNLAIEPRGENGFGYDPIFIPVGFDQSFAEIPESIKNQISHRAIAIDKIAGFLAFLSKE